MVVVKGKSKKFIIYSMFKWQRYIGISLVDTQTLELKIQVLISLFSFDFGLSFEPFFERK
jgi:uncharacterized membrane protein